MNGNPVHFYAEDGSGFDFIGECLIEIDVRNPQLAARMACLNRLHNTRRSGKRT